MKLIKVGLIGLGGRGTGLIGTILACDGVEITAVSDLYDDRIEKGVAKIEELSGKKPIAFKNHSELINSSEVDAVVIATNWEAHTDLAVESMRAGKYTAVEVGGAYELEDSWMLVRTYEETKTPIMFLENCCFGKFELTATALARDGKFGKIVYCHGAYSHELLGEILGGDTNRHYRLRNYAFRNCDNYPSHELGPISKLLNINRGNRMLTLSSVSTKSGVGLSACADSQACPDPNQKGREFRQGDIVLTTITTAGGELITIKLDTTLPRYYSREFTVRGTRGLCEGAPGMFAFTDETKFHDEFSSVEFLKSNMGNIDKYSDYIPECWKRIENCSDEFGHGGIDYLEFQAFFSAIRNGSEMPIDVYDMALWMSVSALSEQSIALAGAPVAVPDFTRGKWMTRPSADVAELPSFEKSCNTRECKIELGYSRP